MTTQPDKSPNSPTEPWLCCNGHPEVQNNQFKCKYCNTTYDDYLRNNPIPEYATQQLSYQQLTKQLEKSEQELLDLHSQNNTLNEDFNQTLTQQANQISYLQSENQQLTEQLDESKQELSNLLSENYALTKQISQLNQHISTLQLDKPYQNEELTKQISQLNQDLSTLQSENKLLYKKIKGKSWTRFKILILSIVSPFIYVILIAITAGSTTPGATLLILLSFYLALIILIIRCIY